MIALGNFFFRFRNLLFPLAILLVFVPSPALFNHSLTALIIGGGLLLLGQGLRVGTIGLFYIVRGGRKQRVYAENLVTEGLFSHCRNPLYLGNLLMLLGFGIAVNSWWCFAIGGLLFGFIYAAIIRAEEAFLQTKFGRGYDAYCADVPRWWLRLDGIIDTLRSQQFNWTRVLLKEYGTLANWMIGLPLALYLRQHWLGQNDWTWPPTPSDAALLVAALGGLLTWAFIRTLKKTGRLVERKA